VLVRSGRQTLCTRSRCSFCSTRRARRRTRARSRTALACARRTPPLGTASGGTTATRRSRGVSSLSWTASPRTRGSRGVLNKHADSRRAGGTTVVCERAIVRGSSARATVVWCELTPVCGERRVRSLSLCSLTRRSIALLARVVSHIHTRLYSCRSGRCAGVGCWHMFGFMPARMPCVVEARVEEFSRDFRFRLRIDNN